MAAARSPVGGVLEAIILAILGTVLVCTVLIPIVTDMSEGAGDYVALLGLIVLVAIITIIVGVVRAGMGGEER